MFSCFFIIWYTIYRYKQTDGLIMNITVGKAFLIFVLYVIVPIIIVALLLFLAYVTWDYKIRLGVVFLGVLMSVIIVVVVWLKKKG